MTTDRAEAMKRILELLAEGQSMASICRDKDMPSREAVRLWQREDADFDAAVMRAREDGYEKRATEAVEEAKRAEDPAKGRLAFDAERWYLGKLSIAFSDDKAQKLVHSGQVGLKAIEIQFGRGPKAGE